MTRTFLLLAALLAGCSSVSEVTPLGSDTLSVTSTTRTGMMDWGELRTMAVTRANSYCSAKGKTMEMIGDIQDDGVRHITPRESTVKFKCV